MEHPLIFQTSPEVTLATNKFINVPIVLKFEDTNLIEVVNIAGLGYTNQIPIHHQDGTYLAKVVGNRLYATEDGKKAGVKIEKYKDLWVCKMENQTLFEIEQQSGDAFKTTAELYTPEGYFVKYSDAPNPLLYSTDGNALKIGGFNMSGSTIANVKVGIWMQKDGSCNIGVAY